MATSNLELVLSLKGADKVGGALKGLGKTAAGLGKLALFSGAGAAIAGIGGLGAALVSGIGDARAAAITFAQTEAVIKSTGGAAGVTADQVSDYAASLSAASGASLFGDDQIQESTNLLLTFTNIEKGALEAATAMSVDMAQAMGGAPRDAAIQLGKALNDPIAGIGALSRVGVTFTEDQKNVIKSLVETGDVAGAQAVILAELNKEFGGSAAAAAAADGGMAQFKDSMGELAETVGAAVLPMLGVLVGFLNTSVMPALTTGVGYLMEVGAMIGEAFAEDGVSGAIDQVLFEIERLVPGLAPVVAFIGDTLVPAFQLAFGWLKDTALPAVITGLTGIWNSIQLLITGDFSGGIFGLSAEAGWIVALLTARDWIRGIWNSVQLLITGDYTGGIFGLAPDAPWIQSILNFREAIITLGERAGVVFDWFVSTGLPNLVGALQDSMPRNTELIRGFFAAISEEQAKAAPAFTSYSDRLRDMQSNTQFSTQAQIAHFLTWNQETGAKLQENMNKVGEWADWFHEHFVVKARANLEEFMGYVDPTFAEFRNVINEAVADVQQTWTNFSDAIVRNWNVAVAGLISDAQQLYSEFYNAFQSINTAAVNAVNEVVTFFGGLPGRITGAVGDLGSLLYQAGKDVVQGLINGITEKAGAIASTITSAISGAVSAGKAALGIKSPSTVFHDIGEDTMQGLIDGIGSKLPDLTGLLGEITYLMETKTFRGDILGFDEDTKFGRWLQAMAEDTENAAAVLRVLKGEMFGISTSAGGGEWVTDGHPFIEMLKAMALASGTVSIALGTGKEKAQDLGKAYLELGIAFELGTQAHETNREALEKVVKAKKEATTTTGELTAALYAEWGAFELGTQAHATNRAALEKVIKAKKEAVSTTGELTAAVYAEAGAFELGTRAHNTDREALEKVIKAKKDATATTGDLTIALYAEWQAFELGTTAHETNAAALDRVTEAGKKAQGTTDKLTQALLTGVGAVATTSWAPVWGGLDKITDSATAAARAVATLNGELGKIPTSTRGEGRSGGPADLPGLVGGDVGRGSTDAGRRLDIGRRMR